ncbi:hypothetical protein J1TS3_06210 [Siminovitchia fordii]|uniref:Uncharacterized protein n=1 Tax=Siminovitchia fordii TaxID=254759 RepID=A0ABQ4K2Y9_9BACI|nr:hypothetical protein J1TS3_06210 [Siminovitchia fordii]
MLEKEVKPGLRNAVKMKQEQYLNKKEVEMNEENTYIPGTPIICFYPIKRVWQQFFQFGRRQQFK